MSCAPRSPRRSSPRCWPPPRRPRRTPTPVVGAGSFTTAPILEPGSYRDTVLPEEYLYYGVRVGGRAAPAGDAERRA